MEIVVAMIATSFDNTIILTGVTNINVKKKKKKKKTSQGYIDRNA